MATHETEVKPELREVTRLIEWIDAHCAEQGLPEDFKLKLTLALEEAVVNVITHAFKDLPPPHSITVRLDITDASVVAEIIDNGMGFDPTAAPEPDLSSPVADRPTGGLGIHLMHSMVDRIRYRRSDGKNILLLETARR
jgi:anti-sigma regulatory factor (Ser/Thr protein kinase)